MSAITAAMVKELREKTGAGMLNCKNALKESDGDMEKAVEELRKKGIASADKKSSRLASEGLIHIAQDGSSFGLVEVNCETDFVGKNKDFQDFVKNVAKVGLKAQPKDIASFLAAQFFETGKTLEEFTKEMVAKIGENISVRRFSLIQKGENELVGAYIHMGSKIGALVKVAGDLTKISEDTVKGIAMHVAAVAPRFVRAEDIPQEVKDKEKEIFKAQMTDSGKPPEILDKIIDGKLKKFISEVCLEDQVYIKDPDGKNSVAKFLKQDDPSAKILEFIRFQVGEGLQKKNEDFAAEVAKQISAN